MNRSHRRLQTRVMVAAIVVAGMWWLFGGTYSRHVRGPVDDNTIRFAHFGTYQDYALWQGVIAEFRRGHPDVSVVQEYVVGLAGRYNIKMRQQILSHTLPEVALVQLGPFRDQAHHFADLSEFLGASTDPENSLLAALEPTGVQAFQVAGRQRGLPVAGGSLLVYVNPECFERAGRHLGRSVPLPRSNWTIEDFRHTAELLTCDFDGDSRVDQFGFWKPRWIYYLPFLWSFGARLTDDSVTRWELQGPEAERALVFYRELTCGHPVSPRESQVPQLFQDVGFLTGKVAMCVNGPWFQPFLADTKLADSYSVAPIPRGPGGQVTRITWDGIVMRGDAGPRRRAIAWQFIAFVLSAPVQDCIAAAARALPARTESAGLFVDPPGNPRRQPFVDALAYSRLQPMLGRFSEIDRAINRHFAHFADPSCVLTADASLRQLADEPVIRKVLSGLRADPP